MWPFQVLLSADDTRLDHDSKAQTEHVRSVAVERVGAAVARLRGPAMAALDDALRLRGSGADGVLPVAFPSGLA